MDNYMQRLINYFFHHDVSDELTGRMYRRLSSPADDKEKEEAVAAIWKELEGTVCPEEEAEAAYRRLKLSLEQRRAVTPAPEKRKNWRMWRRIAAVWFVPLLMLGTSACLFYKAKTAQKKSPEITYIQHYAALGTREKVVLPDSSVVWLNAGSLLIHPTSLSSETRKVYLSGEAFFEVSKDQKHPFVVTTGHLQLTVLGTSFNVSAYPDNEQTKATLETGALEVEVEGQAGRFRLNPNEQLVYTPATDKVELLRVRATDYSAWRTGGLFFNDVPLGDVLRTLECAYAVKFHLYTSAYQKQILRVHFNKDESLENVLEIIRMLIPGIEYKIEEKDVYLK